MFKSKVEKMAFIGATERTTGKAVKFLAFSNTFEEYVLFPPVICFDLIHGLRSKEFIRIGNVGKRTASTYYMEKF